MRHRFGRVLFAVAGVLMLCSSASAQVSRTVLEMCERDEQCRERRNQEMLVEMVKQAQGMIGEKGEDVFVEFRQPGSVWNNGTGPDLFVVGMDGSFVAYPSPEYVGKDGLDMPNVNGKPFARSTVESKESVANSWVSRWWRKIKGFRILRKQYEDYVRAPNGNVYVIASSLDIPATQRDFVQRLVNDAAELVREKGKAAFPVFYEPDSKFRFKDTYVFVLEANGTIVVEPIYREIEGKALQTLDPEDAALLKGPIELMRALEQVEDSGWEIYEWYKPGGDKPVRKASYGRKVRADGKTYIVGTGVYLND